MELLNMSKKYHKLWARADDDITVIIGSFFILFIKVILAIRGLLSDIYYDPENDESPHAKAFGGIYFLDLQIVGTLRGDCKSGINFWKGGKTMHDILSQNNINLRDFSDVQTVTVINNVSDRKSVG